MSMAAATNIPAAESLLADLRASIRTERRFVAAEVQAFDAFIDRIESVTPDYSTPTSTFQHVGSDGGHSGCGLSTVQAAYEQTVMDCDHYDEEYADTYAESVTAEFGPEVGTLLVTESRLQPRLKDALLERARTSRDNREHLLEILDAESESIDAVAADFQSVATELGEFTACSESDVTGCYGMLEAEWQRLGVLTKKGEELSATRQQAIIAQRRRFDLPFDAPDIPAYLYQEFDSTYPLLAAFVQLQERIQELRSERAGALGRV